MRQTLLPALFVLILAACGSSSTETEPQTTTADTHGVSTDPNAAIGFYTENITPPATATDSKDDGVLRDADDRPYNYAHLGAPLPAFSGSLQDGTVFDSAEIDQWTLVYVWGTWCGDCRRDGPYTSQVATRLAADPDLDFVSVHTPISAARADEAFQRFGSLDAYFDSVGYTFPTLIDEDASIRDALAISWTPTYLLVSPEGVVSGFRTDLSVAGENSVEQFLSDIQTVKDEADT